MVCQECRWREEEVEDEHWHPHPRHSQPQDQDQDLRQRMARALVVIEALRKRLRDAEGRGGGPPGGDDFASLDPVGQGAGAADAAVMRATAEVLIQEATSGLQVELEAARNETKAARQLVVELEVQVVEKDTLVGRLQSQMNQVKAQLRQVSANPVLDHAVDRASAARDQLAPMPVGSGGQQNSLVVNAEEHRREIASLWRRIQEGINDLRVARAEKEELRERLRCDALGREAFELQRLRLQRLHREMAHTIEEHRHKCEALESNWVRWVLMSTQAVCIGMVYIRPLKRGAAAAIRGLDAGHRDKETKTLEALTGGAPRFVVAHGEAKAQGRIEIYARQRDDLPVVVFSTRTSRVEVIDGEFNFLIFGYFIPDDMTQLQGGGVHDESESDSSGSDFGGPGRKAVRGTRQGRGGVDANVGNWDDIDEEFDEFDLADSDASSGDDFDEDRPGNKWRRGGTGADERLPDFIVECDRLQAKPTIQYRKWRDAFRAVGLLEGVVKSSAAQVDYGNDPEAKEATMLTRGV